jgi:altronate hydrolase
LTNNADPYWRMNMNMNMDMDMDLDCGGIPNGQPGIAEAGRHLFDCMLAIASGRRSRSEEHGPGDIAFLSCRTWAAR